MATVYGNNVYNTPQSLYWQTYVVYDGTTADLYGYVGGSGSMWVKFGDPHIGGTYFSTVTGTYSSGTAVWLGRATISQTSSYTFGATCTGGSWGQNGTSSGTIPVQSVPPTYNSTNASSITETSVRLTASIDTHGFPLTDGGWDVGLSTSSYTYYSGGQTDKTISGLQPGTTYYYRGYAVNAGGGVNSSWKSFTTLDYKTYYKVAGSWKACVPYYKVSGSWKKCIPYIKVNGEWKVGRQ